MNVNAKKILEVISKMALITIIALFLGECKFSRMVIYNKAGIKDYKIFPSRELYNDPTGFTFFNAGKSEFFLQEHFQTNQVHKIDSILETSGTVAFLIIRNDTILFEKYFEEYDPSSLVPSFSIAKPLFSTLIGCAIDDGLIHSIHDPITQYVPELRSREGFDKVTIEHLLQMTSGIKFEESYTSPFSEVTALYYGTNLKKYVLKMRLEIEPGMEFKYISGNTQLLGLALKNALAGKTITQYFLEKLWGPMGMEFEGTWSIDSEKNGFEKTFCCINAAARDFAKFGRLYLNKGNWNGRQLVSEEWIVNSTKVDTTNGSWWNYQYNWWLPSNTGDYMALGKGGQVLYVNPSKNMIIVRLGIKSDDTEWSSFVYSIGSYVN